MMNLQLLKRNAALECCQHLKQYDACDLRVGIGSGSTVNEFIKLLVFHKFLFLQNGVVSSSSATTALLKENGIVVEDLNNMGGIDIYIDGADEVSPLLQMLKGLGGALVREKIVASASKKIICIASDDKYVKRLGGNKTPVVLEVVPMARSQVARTIVTQFGGTPDWRLGFVSDNGNHILDVYNLDITEPILLERSLKLIPGVVECGIFAVHAANDLFLALSNGQVKHINNNP